MRKTPSDWSARQLGAMYWQQRSTLKSARAWRLKMALREVYALARSGGITHAMVLDALLLFAPHWEARRSRPV